MTPGLLLRSTDDAGIPPPRGEPDWQSIGSVQAIYCRESRTLAPTPMQTVETVTGHGILGDQHASPHSPRQILIAGDDAYERFELPEASLRENFRISFSTTALRSGDLLRFGPDVVLWLTFHCEPCSLLERRCAGVTKTIGQQRGMLARVLRGGSCQAGDEVWLARSWLPAISEAWQTRVSGVACAVPAGHCISYRQLAEMAGVASSYCRAFPKLLSRLPLEVSSRVVSAAAVLPGVRWAGDELFDVDARVD